MKELSLNILDIAENSLKAGSTLTEIIIEENDSVLTITIKDNGCGMPESVVESVSDPFYTTRTTRSVGMGLSLLKLEAEQTGGNLTIVSKTMDDSAEGHGTGVTAMFFKNHIDFTPLGDIVATIKTLIQGHPDTEFLFKHSKNRKLVMLDTREIRGIIDDVPLDSYEIVKWIEEYLKDQYS